MAYKTKTTESLRETLFDTLDKLTKREIDVSEATAITKIADSIIKTADIELKYAATVDKLDAHDQGISPGPLLLTNK